MNSLASVLNATAVMKEPDRLSTSMTAAVTQMATWGVWRTGCTASSGRGSCPCSAIAYRRRGATSMFPFIVPKIDTAAPTTMKSPPAGPRNCPAASASGRDESASPGKVPAQTIWMRM